MVSVVAASEQDCEAILALQKLAFERIVIRTNVPTIPPMAETLAELRQDFANSTILKALLGDQLVGSVRGAVHNKVCQVRRMAVHPEHQGKGVGTALLSQLELTFAGVGAFELFTHSRNVEAIGLYKRHGYRVTRTEVLPASGPMVFMAKVRSVAP